MPLSLSELKARFDYPTRAGRVDWHCHSSASDGIDSPAQLVRLAKRAGLDEVALTDHDSLSGLPEALRAGKKYGVRVVAGVEFNTNDLLAGVSANVHVLGLGINPRHPRLLGWLARLARHREERTRQTLSNLQSLGYRITFQDVRHLVKGTFNRPMVARALLARAENRRLLRKMFGLKAAPTVSDVFDHLIGRGARAYAKGRRLALTPPQAFRLVRSAGGLPVVAHPIICDIENGFMPLPLPKLRAYARAGCGGVEVYYNNYIMPKQNTRAVRERWGRECRKLGLALTGGGDHHGYGKMGLAGHSLGQIPYP